MSYNIRIWEEIRDRVKWKVYKLPEDIKREIASDDSLQEFRGSDQIPWQLGEVLQQRAQSWIQGLYDFCCDAYRALGKDPSIEFDMAVWAYCIEPFIMKEETNENGYRASLLLELMLCAVGSSPEKRRFLTVSQKDCCVAVRNQVSETWRYKLLHLPSKWNEAGRVMAAYNAIERQARLMAAGLPAVERKPLHSIIPVVQPQEAAKSTPMGTDPRHAAERSASADQDQSTKQSDVGHASEIANKEEPPARLESAVQGKWEDIEILFLSDDRVQILREGKRCETLNYAEFGFEDRRNGNPNQAWLVLRRLAEKKGWLASPLEAQVQWSKLEKRIQEIRLILRKHFGISSDPIPFVEKTRPEDKSGYNVCFKISCGTSYRT